MFSICSVSGRWRTWRFCIILIIRELQILGVLDLRLNWQVENALFDFPLEISVKYRSSDGGR